MKRALIYIALLTGALFTSQAKVKPSSLIGDNMVLQQRCNARIWGTADPGEHIKISTSWDDKTYDTITDRCGDWSLAVQTPAGSYTPYTITICDGDTLTINNVLIGEVWLASGQSNMEMPLKGFSGCVTENGYKEIAGSRAWADKVRFFNVPLKQSYTPVDTVVCRWDIPDPTTAPSFSAVAWHYAKQMSDVLNVPVGIVSAAYGGAKVESWTPRDMLEKYPDISLDEKDIKPIVHYLRPMLMYNAMFNPVKQYTYKGIIWYQGCSNVDTYDTYADRLTAMVKRWRDEIGLGDIPFYAVEIAPYEYVEPHEPGQPSAPEKSPYLREAQWDAISRLKNAGMICINDLIYPYERYNIHPAQKEEVGRRLCNLALNKTYGHTQFPCESPRYKSHRIVGDKVYVAIHTNHDGVCRNYDIRGFEVCGADKVFYPADNATFNWQTNEVVVSSTKVPAPVAVRYCFHDFMSGTLYGGNHLPLIPFRSDK